MTTAAENEILAHVGPGTPMGEALRRYWWPVGISADLKDKPTFIRVLGEDLVLYRDAAGQPGVLAALCAHRRANLCLGAVGPQGLRCRYHGWVYDREGRVLETPGEPEESSPKHRVRQTAYPAEELGGLIFVYMGPQPAPLLPRFQFLAAEGERDVRILGFSRSNWLQCVENGMDPLHVSFTHGEVWTDLKPQPEVRFIRTDWGLYHAAVRPTAHEGVFNYREHHLVMPGISCGGAGQRFLEGAAGTPWTGARWSVPLDDTETMVLRVSFKAADNPGRYRVKDHLVEQRWEAVRVEPYGEYRQSDNPVLGYTIPRVISTEDATVMDSMGPIVDRENEIMLPVGDSGMRTLRAMYLEIVEDVRAGRDPLGTIRDPARNQCVEIPAYEYEIDAAERDRLLAAGVH